MVQSKGLLWHCWWWMRCDVYERGGVGIKDYDNKETGIC